MQEKKCCAETEKRKCLILTCHKCQGHEVCSIFKTEEQAEHDRKKAFERIASLSFEEQVHISKTYYNHKMPWL